MILARNWRGAGGELDLVALEGDVVVFVEVKTRQGAFPEEHPLVREAQKRRNARAARAFRARYGVRRRPYRFDLVRIENAGERDGGRAAWQKGYHRTEGEAVRT